MFIGLLPFVYFGIIAVCLSTEKNIKMPFCTYAGN